MGNIGVTEILLIALVALLLFGAGRIADIGKGLGQGIKNFKQVHQGSGRARRRQGGEARRGEDRRRSTQAGVAGPGRQPHPPRVRGRRV